MKRILLTIITMLILLPLFASVDTIKDNGIQNLIGYVYSGVSFTVSLNGNVPFNLESNAVKENPSPAVSIKGLQIGTYSLEANTAIKLYIAHDKLHLVDRTFGTSYTNDQGILINDPGTLSEIDYRLYLKTGPTGSFLSCKSADNASVTDYSLLDSITEKMLIQGNSVSLTEQGMYLSLEDPTTKNGETNTTNTVESLKAGTYSSNIYFYLEVGS